VLLEIPSIRNAVRAFHLRNVDHEGGSCQGNGPPSPAGVTSPNDRREQSSPNPFRCFNASPEVIRMTVMLYVRYPLSLRNVEDLLFERGVHMSPLNSVGHVVEDVASLISRLRTGMSSRACRCFFLRSGPASQHRKHAARRESRRRLRIMISQWHKQIRRVRPHRQRKHLAAAFGRTGPMERGPAHGLAPVDWELVQMGIR